MASPDFFKGRPGVYPRQLRNMLIDSLYSGSLQGSHKLKAVKTDPFGLAAKHELHFEVNAKTGFDLVLGVDGAWSKVGHLISAIRPQFSGITSVDAKFSNIDTANPALSKRVGNCICLTLGANTTVLLQRNGDGSIKSYGFYQGTMDWRNVCGIDWSIVRKANKDLVCKYYHGFTDDAKNLLQEADDYADVTSVEHRWAHRQGLTLISDAAHIMKPFAGVGVNVAMEGALPFATQIKQWKRNDAFSSLIEPIRGYEEEMSARAEGHAKEAMTYRDLLFHERGGISTC